MSTKGNAECLNLVRLSLRDVLKTTFSMENSYTESLDFDGSPSFFGMTSALMFWHKQSLSFAVLASKDPVPAWQGAWVVLFLK